MPSRMSKTTITPDAGQRQTRVVTRRTQMLHSQQEPKVFIQNQPKNQKKQVVDDATQSNQDSTDVIEINFKIEFNESCGSKKIWQFIAKIEEIYFYNFTNMQIVNEENTACKSE